MKLLDLVAGHVYECNEGYALFDSVVVQGSDRYSKRKQTRSMASMRYVIPDQPRAGRVSRFKTVAERASLVTPQVILREYAPSWKEAKAKREAEAAAEEAIMAASAERSACLLELADRLIGIIGHDAGSWSTHNGSTVDLHLVPEDAEVLLKLLMTNEWVR